MHGSHWCDGPFGSQCNTSKKGAAAIIAFVASDVVLLAHLLPGLAHEDRGVDENTEGDRPQDPESSSAPRTSALRE